MLKRIMTFDELTNVINKMAKQAFKMFCYRKRKYGRWSMELGEMAEKVIEVNMIFVVRQ